MTNTEKKKELYKQKPTADFNRDEEGKKIYTTQIIVNGLHKVIFFAVPFKECEFEETVPAQLLIRWMV